MSSNELDLSPRLGSRGDDVYAALVEAHRGLSERDSARLNVRLVLLLSNQVGSVAAVLEAISMARAGISSAPDDVR
jgi:hypothetical protein